MKNISIKKYFIVNPIIFCLGIVAATAISCQNEMQEKEGAVFRYNEPGGISSLDPAYSRNLENIWAVNQIFDGLVALDSNLKPQPLMAASWSMNDKKDRYSFKLRSGVFFHEDACFKQGTRAVNASDVVYSFNRIADAKTASPGRWVLDLVARNEDESLNITVHSSDSLTLYLKQSAPQFLSLLAMQYCTIVPKEAIDYYGEDFRSHPVGTGPFKIFIWEEGNKLVLHKNPRYYLKDANGNSLPYLDAIAVSFIKDQSAALMAMQRGDFDFMSGLDAASKHRVLTPKGELAPEFAEDFNAIKTPFLKTDYLGFRLGLDSVLDNPQVRRALSMAINREDLVAFVLNGLGTAAKTGFVPPVLWSQSFNAEELSYQPEKAKAIVESLPQLKKHPIVISTPAMAMEVCEFVQKAWSNIGLNVSIEVLPSSHHREQVSGGQIALFRKSWIADYPDPENFLSLFRSDLIIPKGPNYFFYNNPEFDVLYELSNIATGEEREQLLWDMQRIVNQELPLIPLFHDDIFQLKRKEVKHLKTDAMNVLDLTRVQIVN
ncbi:ABC transporter substrate-binding protein [Luteibaculum oceani]|uniref:ABC transporter substrate-binding protein n=1 Tax=Luteibaculum oceani TaxID=1294296 RepID=A0A5C6V520_9FLAO|nr:ABC transporter substrate-binding protein [Luteibaculum oceani]TXC78675.1 ABC transporter substrate-binding protein [Luteibaculum oceani]